MPEVTHHLIRNIDREEAGKASRFIEEHSKSNCKISESFCYHYSKTIFASLDNSGNWLGILACFASPLKTRSAVIEAIAIPAQHNQQEIATALIEHSFNCLKKDCIFHIDVYLNVLEEGMIELLQKIGFYKKEAHIFTRHLLPEKICLQNRLMKPRMNTINGEISEDTLFHYSQEGDFIWGNYAGGPISRGVLLGRMARNGDINFHYMQINDNGELHTGTSHSATEFLNDGRIILYEDWEWTGNRTGSGRSVIEEIKEED